MDTTVDKSNLRKIILEMAGQFEQGLKFAKDIKFDGDFKSITISGMGGSALPGNIVRIYLGDLFERGKGRSGLAVYHNRFYSLPKEAYNNSLNIICSFSGNTEETIESFQEAIDNKLPCVGISSGGKVEEMCKENNIQHVKLAGFDESFEPRQATGYFFASIFQILMNCDLIDDCAQEIVETAEKLKEDIVKLEERGKELAEKLKGKTPVVYSSTKFKSLAMIWKIKINENSKTPCFWNYFPELNHNELMGFTNPQADFFFVMLRDKDDHPRNVKRYAATAELMKKKNMDSEIIDIVDGSVFYKIFSTLYLGDWTSYYLALVYGQDPTPSDAVEEFKALIK